VNAVNDYEYVGKAVDMTGKLHFSVWIGRKYEQYALARLPHRFQIRVTGKRNVISVTSVHHNPLPDLLGFKDCKAPKLRKSQIPGSTTASNFWI
jgi:hypothetical protein